CFQGHPASSGQGQPRSGQSRTGRTARGRGRDPVLARRRRARGRLASTASRGRGVSNWRHPAGRALIRRPASPVILPGPDRPTYPAGWTPPPRSVPLAEDLEAFGDGGEERVVLVGDGGAAAQDEAVRAVDHDVFADRPYTPGVVLGAVQAGSGLSAHLRLADLEGAEPA